MMSSIFPDPGHANTDPVGDGIRRPRQGLSLASVVRLLRRADLPDHAAAGDLNQRSVGWIDELRGWIGLAEVPHRAVVHEIRTAVRTELEIHRAVDSANTSISERLVPRRIEGELRLL